MTPEAATLSKKDFVSDQQVRWCPGCGDYAILAAVQQAFAEIGVPREKVVVVSGIGCAARFPYYMECYGFHTIHGRAPAIATGLKVMRPELSVWVVGGDGDMLSIGGNHLLHALRRNVGLKILCFNNEIYGLTKGQASPTSTLGKITGSTPMGSVDRPIKPISVALAAEATFVARTVDIFGAHLRETLLRVAKHEGSAFVEILQNCVIFNDGAFAVVTERGNRDDTVLYLEHGKPLVFGKNRDKGLRQGKGGVEVVPIGEGGVPEGDLMVFDERDESMSYLLSRMGPPQFPTPVGVFRCVEGTPLEKAVQEQAAKAKSKGGGDLMALLRSGDTWEVK
jgi:2-oxoglutarate ferredoxin oxidoreductase subunit beta